MSETASLTVELPRDVLDSLESLAERTGRAISALAGEARIEYVRLQDSHLAAIYVAIAETDAWAPTYADEDFMAWLESWETANELPPPR